MGELYFERTNGELVYIAEIDEEKCIKYIRKYVKKLNSNFEIYYIRCWETPDGIKYDVGSHTEFFLFKRIKN